MAKKQAQTELEVVSCFDGELDAVEVFANLIARQCQGMSETVCPLSRSSAIFSG